MNFDSLEIKLLVWISVGILAFLAIGLFFLIVIFYRHNLKSKQKKKIYVAKNIQAYSKKPQNEIDKDTEKTVINEIRKSFDLKKKSDTYETNIPLYNACNLESYSTYLDKIFNSNERIKKDPKILNFGTLNEVPIAIHWDVTDTFKTDRKHKQANNDIYFTLISNSCFKFRGNDSTQTYNHESSPVKNKISDVPYDSYIEVVDINDLMIDNSLLLLLDKSTQVSYSTNKFKNDCQFIDNKVRLEINPIHEIPS